MDEDAPIKRPAFVIGQDISTFSVGDLDETIGLLKAEIARLEEARKSKDSTRSAAEALFRRS
jgi:uncharacterized small protein (DUF1192 family)